MVLIKLFTFESHVAVLNATRQNKTISIYLKEYNLLCPVTNGDIRVQGLNSFTLF